MNQTNQEPKTGRKLSKKWLSIILVAVFLIGGGVAAYVILDLSPKEKYFVAEHNSFDELRQLLKNRYKEEREWLQTFQENPNENIFEVSAELNDPMEDAMDEWMSPSQVINNSSLTLETQTDLENQVMSFSLGGSSSGFSVEDFNLHLVSEDIIFEAPFLKDGIRVNGKEIGNILYTIDPWEFTGEESIDVPKVFERTQQFISEEDKKHIEEKYMKMIYEELPDHSFEEEKDTIDINDQSVKADKITMYLTEEEIKNILSHVLDTMEEDEQFKEILLLGFQDVFTSIAFDLMDEEELNTDDIEEGIQSLKDDIEDLEIPKGLTSTIWVQDKKVIKRDFSIEFGPSMDELVLLSITGTQSQDDSQQKFDYQFKGKDEFDEVEFSLTGDLGWKDNKGNDMVEIDLDEVKFTYEGSESIVDGEKEFKRKLNFTDDFGESGSLMWTGNASYAKDKMSSEHAFSIIMDDLGSDFFTLYIDREGKKLKSVEAPKTDSMTDLGQMSEDELIDYFDEEFAVQLEDWIIKMFGPAW